MAVNVYGWKKPTLTLSVSEGGSLLANTKYYVAGAMVYTPQVYNSVGSELSDINEITTTTTAKSIVISHKTWDVITQFEASAGKTLCTSYRHCLSTDDTINIIDSSYNGTWKITKIDYNRFTINSSFYNDIDASYYTGTIFYNKPDMGSTASGGMVYYVNPLNPVLTTDSSFWNILGGYWTRTPYQTTGIQNPVVISTQPAQSNALVIGNQKVRNVNSGIYKASVPNGTILVSLSGTTETIGNIYTTCVSAGYENNVFYSSRELTFALIGSLVTSTTGKLALTGWDITLVCGELFTPSNYQSNLLFNGCLINTIPRMQQAQMIIDGSNNAIYNNNSANNYSGMIYGKDNAIYFPLLTYNYDYSFNYINLDASIVISCGMVQNKKFLSNGNTSLMQTTYGQQKFYNCTLYPIYWNSIITATSYRPNIYMMENCIMNQSGSNLFHFRFYSFPAQQPYWNYVKYLNINTDVSNNMKKCVNNSIVNIIVDFYRRGEFYLEDQSGVAIQGASILVSDNSNNVYSGTTDASGYVAIDVIEEKFYLESSMGTHSSYDPTHHSYYNNYNINITKSGYLNQTLKLDSFYTKGFYSSIFNLSMIEEPDPVYIDQHILGSIKTNYLDGTNPSNKLRGQVQTTILLNSN